MKIETTTFLPTIWFYFIHFEESQISRLINSYTKKLAAPDVIDIMNRNRSIIGTYCELVDEALFRYNIAVINNDEISKKVRFSIMMY